MELVRFTHTIKPKNVAQTTSVCGLVGPQWVSDALVLVDVPL